MAITPGDKAEILSRHLESVFCPNPSNKDSAAAEEEVADFMATLGNTAVEEASLPTISKEDIGRALRRLPPRKAPGSDGIPNAVLRELPKAAAAHLASIFNGCARLSYFPSTWRRAKIICLPKKLGQRLDPGDFRPISLLDGFGKLFERLLLEPICDHVREGGFLPDAQFGFRERHSTVHQLARTTDFITDAFNRGDAAVGAFFDISKCFDRVWQEALLLKMHRLDFPTWLTKIIAAYLRGRSFRVHWFEGVSGVRRITAGVPQGSILGPVLFNIFAYDIPQDHGPRSLLSLYADDAAIICESRVRTHAVTRLRRAVCGLTKWYRTWRVAVNEKKTSAVFFHPRRKRPPTARLTINGEELPWKSEVLYLGVVLDQQLTWTKNIARVRAKAFAALGRLRPILCPPVLSMDTKRRLYRACVLPVITYASPVWSGVPEKSLYRLQVVQNSALRCILGRGRESHVTDMHKDGNLDTLYVLLPKMAEAFYADAAESTIATISALGSIRVRPSDRYKRPIASLGTPDSQPPPKKPRFQ